MDISFRWFLACSCQFESGNKQIKIGWLKDFSHSIISCCCDWVVVTKMVILNDMSISRIKKKNPQLQQRFILPCIILTVKAAFSCVGGKPTCTYCCVMKFTGWNVTFVFWRKLYIVLCLIIFACPVIKQTILWSFNSVPPSVLNLSHIL